MRNNFLGKIDRHERDIFMTVEVALAGCDNGLRTGLDEVVHDGEVVRRQIPKHVDVVLEEAKIDARRVIVVEVPQRALVDQLRNSLNRTGEQKGMVNHDLEVLLLREIDQFLSLCGSAGKRLLNEDMFAIFKRRFRQLVVSPHRRDDRDHVNIRR